MSMYYFGIALFITIVIAMASYIATVIGLLAYRFCFCRTQKSVSHSVSTVKYESEADGRAECSIKQLQQCKHFFHSSCIDMCLLALGKSVPKKS
ncbi:hypothetical protein ACJRO7_025042 [Eucalyptus globulus]|uniref:Uncharacterized protein n=1 Tax=Eucalyptus globulus TaxID=34317 RepID=A0ABD3KDK5_EUCGL